MSAEKKEVAAKQKAKRRMKTMIKQELMESGEAVFGGNMRDINLILENIVYLELLRRGYVVTVGRGMELNAI